jgi:hypothetical protein
VCPIASGVTLQRGLTMLVFDVRSRNDSVLRYLSTFTRPLFPRMGDFVFGYSWRKFVNGLKNRDF